MLPRRPARPQSLGFIYAPPFRVQGVSIAGEETAVQIPEADVCFDVGRCPREVLTSNYVALSHGHMDHAAGLAYYFSQRHFQGMGEGTVVCHPKIAPAVRNIMAAWVGLENQKTPYHVIELADGEEMQVKPDVTLRAFETVHTVPSLGFSLIEKRSKLRPELIGLPQEKLIELKRQGEEISRIIEIHHLSYLGDTMWGDFIERNEVRKAGTLVTECTFLEPEHRGRAKVGRHLHIQDIARLLEVCEAKTVILTHLSRRTHMAAARKFIAAGIPAEHRSRVALLMDHGANRLRFERQAEELGEEVPSQHERKR